MIRKLFFSISEASRASFPRLALSTVFRGGREAADIVRVGTAKSSLSLSLSLSTSFRGGHSTCACTRRRPRRQRRRRRGGPLALPPWPCRTQSGRGRKDCIASWQSRFNFIDPTESTPVVYAICFKLRDLSFISIFFSLNLVSNFLIKVFFLHKQTRS